MIDNLDNFSKEVEAISDEELLNAYTDDSVKMYIQSISIYPKLTIEEQKELFITGQKNKLINCTLRLVVKVAYKYQKNIKSLQILDIIQEGNMGLLKSLETYDPEKGAFTTYSVFWVRKYIIEAIKKKDRNIRRALHMEELIRKYYNLVDAHKVKGKDITKNEIINSLGITEKKYKTLMMTLSQNIISLNQVAYEDSDDEIGDLVEDEKVLGEMDIIDNIHFEELKTILKIALKPFDYYVIYYRYLVPLNEKKLLDKIGEEFNITKQAVESKEKRILQKIKSYIDSSLGYSFLNNFKTRMHMSIDKIKLEPLSIDAVIKYLYIKEDLTEEELYLYGLMTLSSINYTDEDYQNKLNISLKKLNILKNSINGKLQKKLNDREEYLSFKKAMIKEHGSSIYEQVNNCEGVLLKEEIDYFSNEANKDIKQNNRIRVK